MNLQTAESRERLSRGESSRQRPRRTIRVRRVRDSYPAALVELALLLCGNFDKRKVAAVLGVGISTVYRWVDIHRTAWMPKNALRTDGSASHTARVVSALTTRCENAGFRLSSNLANRHSNSIPIEPIANFKSSDSLRFNRLPDLSAVDSKAEGAPEPLIRAKREIDTNYAMRLSCQQLATIANMPRFKFIKGFTSRFGVPPYHYLLGIRVKRAIELLEYSSESLPVVATTAGFGCAASMQRAFKRFTGASPGTLVKAIAPKRDAMTMDSICPRKL